MIHFQVGFFLKTRLTYCETFKLWPYLFFFFFFFIPLPLLRRRLCLRLLHCLRLPSCLCLRLLCHRLCRLILRLRLFLHCLLLRLLHLRLLHRLLLHLLLPLTYFGFRTDFVKETCDCSFSGDDQSNNNAVETERSFVCRMKCILNTSAGFFKVKDAQIYANNALCESN